MKKTIIVLCFSFAATYLSSVSAATVYEASSLHNAVGRSETVQDLFFDRWSQIVDRQQYLDIYGKINWIPGFKVNSVNRATGKKESVDLTLVRTYGSLTINYPIIGGYDQGDFRKRLAKGSGTTEDGEGESESSGGLWKPKNLQIGFTATGFHYGLTRKTNVNRGTAGDESVTDYNFSQFFDDIFAASLLYMPYIYVHGGAIVSNQIDPNDDGTMSYGASKGGYPQARWFFASNLLSFLNTNATMTKSKLEKIAAGADVVKAVELLTKVPKVVPRLTVTYKQLMLYNDQSYDAVWVNSPTYGNGTPKGGAMTDSEKSHAKLHTLSFLLTEDIQNIFFADFFTELQYCKNTLIDKRTGQQVKLAKFRETRGSLGINFFGFDKGNVSSLKLSFGMGQYWDPAIAVHRKKGTEYRLLGGFGSLKFEHPLAGAEILISRNSSQELRRLAEASDKWALEGSMFFRF